MLTLFSAERRQRRARNLQEAKRLVAEFGEEAIPILERRIDSSKASSHSHAHWKRVLKQAKSLDVSDFETQHAETQQIGSHVPQASV
jgi:hypothetical protein